MYDHFPHDALARGRIRDCVFQMILGANPKHDLMNPSKTRGSPEQTDKSNKNGGGRRRKRKSLTRMVGGTGVHKEIEQQMCQCRRKRKV